MSDSLRSLMINEQMSNSLNNFWQKKSKILFFSMFYIGFLQGWAPRSFPFGTFHSFLFFKRNVPFFSILFFEFLATYETQKNAKNAAFFCKEWKRTQRPFAKNGKEHENVLFFCKRTRERSVLFSIYI